MSTAEKQYFNLLRAALWGSPVDNSEVIEWDTVMRIAEHHGNNAMLADVAFNMKESKGLSQQLAARLQNEMRFNLLKQVKLKQIMVSAVNLLRQHDIEPVLLKGFGLALLYPNPVLRQFSDVDIFVGQQQFREACTLLRTLPGSYNWGEEKEVGRHYNIEFGQYPMEVHRVSSDINDPKMAAYYTAIEQDGLLDNRRTVDFEGFNISVPSVDFQVFFTFYHAWHHFLETGVGWRQLTDVALALHAYHQQLDTEKLRQWLEAMNVMLPWKTFGWLMVEYLGLPAAEMPFYEAASRRRALRLYEKIMKEGYFKRSNGFRQNKPRSAGLRRKIHSFFGVFVDLSFVFPVFPEQAFHEMMVSLKAGFWKLFQKK